MQHKNFLLIVSVFVLSALACTFAERLVFGPGPEDAQKTLQPTPQSCQGDECLNVCLDNLEIVLKTRPFEPLTNEIYAEANADINLVIYQVEGDELVDSTKLWVPPDYVVYQEDNSAHRRIWDFYVSVIPAEQRSMVDEFVIFTDGPENFTAWVDTCVNKPEDWKVGFDILDSDYPLFLADALVHETGHLITLNSSQIPYDENMTFTGRQDHPKCPNFVTNDGCSLPDSYINRFYQRFWKDMYAEWWELNQEAQNAETFDEYRSMLEPFYRAHEDEFISYYAATNIKEDMAESWTYFVLNSRPHGDDIATQKILFYYDFPELVELREEIITGLCSYVSP